MFITIPSVSKKEALTRFVVCAESHGLAVDPSLAFPVRVLRAFNTRPAGPNRSEETQAYIIATGGEWRIDFERAPTKNEWHVIRDSLEQIGSQSFSKASSSSEGILLSILNHLLFETEPSWSIAPQYKESYLKHKQNAFIGAAVAAIKQTRVYDNEELWDYWGDKIGKIISLSPTQVKECYDWLESLWN